MSKQWKCGTCGLLHEDVDQHYKEHHPGNLLFDGRALDLMSKISSEIREIIKMHSIERVKEAGRVTITPEDVDGVVVMAIRTYLAQKR